MATGKQALAFDLPLTADAQPAFSITAACNVTDFAFDSSGSLWFSCVNPSGIARLSAPIGASSIPGGLVNVLQGNAVALAIDEANHIYVSAGTTGGIVVFDPNPVTGSTAAFVNASIEAPTAFLFVGSNLYVSSYGDINEMWTFSLPLTVASTPSVAPSGPFVAQPRDLNLDPDGNLAVACINKASGYTGVSVFGAPSFGAALHAVAFDDLSGVAFGP